MAIGTRSLSALVLLAVSLFLLWSRGRLRSDYFAQLDPWVTLFAGCLAVFAGTAAFRFLRLHERSSHGFGLAMAEPKLDEDGLPLATKNRDLTLLGRIDKRRAFELPPHALLFTTIVLCISIGLLTLNNRALALIADYPRRIGRSGIQYCPPFEIQSEKQKTLQQGCDLIRRAYRLGYAKSLGTCAPSETEDTLNICRLRQMDEPYLHYAWRLLKDRFSALRKASSATNIGAMVTHFESQTGHLETLALTHHDTVAVAQRSSHHLFTNMPDPRQSEEAKIRARLDPSYCIRQYAIMPHVLTSGTGVASQGLVLEHVLGQLLFNPGYKPVVGYCPEFLVHYEAPQDVCERLAKNPDRVLRDQGAHESVVATLGRHKRQTITYKLTVGGRPAQDRSVAEIERIVSFQCLIIDPESTPDDLREYPLSIGGTTLKARELHVSTVDTNQRGQIELYKQLAALMAPGFGYGRLASRVSISSEKTAGSSPSDIQPSAQFRDSDYTLTQLEFLGDTDLFLGHRWIDERPDLLEIYPFHVHLTNFIEVFRGYYKRHRGRL